jgi:pyruvate dehydrogenase phosphatase
MIRLNQAHPGEEKTLAFARGSNDCLRIIGGMACTRAFGDMKFKAPLQWQKNVDALLQSLPKTRRSFRTPKHCHTPPYMTASPELSCSTISCDDYFVVLASDGIYDNLSDQEVVQAVATHLQKSGPVTDGKANLIPRDGNSSTHVIRTALADGKGVEWQSRMLTLSKEGRTIFFSKF